MKTKVKLSKQVKTSNKNFDGVIFTDPNVYIFGDILSNQYWVVDKYQNRILERFGHITIFQDDRFYMKYSNITGYPATKKSIVRHLQQINYLSSKTITCWAPNLKPGNNTKRQFDIDIQITPVSNLTFKFEDTTEKDLTLLDDVKLIELIKAFVEEGFRYEIKIPRFEFGEYVNHVTILGNGYEIKISQFKKPLLCNYIGRNNILYTKEFPNKITDYEKLSKDLSIKEIINHFKNSNNGETS